MAGTRGGGYFSSPRFQKVNPMVDMMTAIRRLVLQDEAQDLMEYGLLAALIAIVAMASVSALGNTIFITFWQNIAQAV
jgi:Flp pilus assembly pilin Flp